MQNIILRYGAIYGLLTAAVTLLFYLGLVPMWLPSLIGFPLLIFIVIKSGREYRTLNGGTASFIQLLKLITGILLFGMLISTLFTFAYTSFMSDDSKQALIEKLVEAQVSMVSKVLPEDQVLDMEDVFRAETKNIFEPFTFLKNLVGGLFGSVIIALIPAALMRTKGKGNKIVDSEILDA